MKIIKFIALAAFAVVAAGSDAATTRTTFRDSMGRKTGSVEDNGKGKITYRDAMGRKTGSSETDRYGKTTYRDAMGRVKGSQK